MVSYPGRNIAHHTAAMGKYVPVLTNWQHFGAQTVYKQGPVCVHFPRSHIKRRAVKSHRIALVLEICSCACVCHDSLQTWCAQWHGIVERSLLHVLLQCFFFFIVHRPTFSHVLYKGGMCMTSRENSRWKMLTFDFPVPISPCQCGGRQMTIWPWWRQWPRVPLDSVCLQPSFCHSVTLYIIKTYSKDAFLGSELTLPFQWFSSSFLWVLFTKNTSWLC